MLFRSVELRRVEDFTPYIGQELQAEIIEVDLEKKRIVVSRRDLLKAEREAKAKAWKEQKEAQAQARKEAMILAAEADKEAAIRRAEGEADAILKVQEATAKGLQMLNESHPIPEVLALKSFETLTQVADGKATKLIIPSEIQNVGGLIAALTETTQVVKGD